MNTIYDVLDDDELDLKPKDLTGEEAPVTGNLVGDMAAQAGLMYLLPKAYKKFTGKGLGGLVAQAAGGAAWGLLSSIRNNKDSMETISAMGKEAMLWPSYDVGFRSVANVFKGARELGLKKSFLTAGQRTWNEIVPELNVIGKIPTSKIPLIGNAMEERFAARSLSELLNPAGENLISSTDPLKKEIGMENLFRTGKESTVRSSMLDITEDIKNTFSFQEKRAVNELLSRGFETKKPEWVDQDTWNKVTTKVLPLLKTVKETAATKAEAEILESNFKAGVSKEMISRFESTVERDILLGKELNKLNMNLQTGKPEDIVKQLHKITKNSNLDEKIRVAAQAYIDMPATTVHAVSRAFHDSNIENFLSNIERKGAGRLIKPMLQAGDKQSDFILVTRDMMKGNKMGNKIFNKFENNYMDWDTYRALFDLADVYRYADSALSRYIVRPWKVTRAVANPPALFRNLFGNFALNAVQGKVPLQITNVKAYANSLRNMKNKTELYNWYVKRAGGQDFAEQELKALEGSFTSSKSKAESLLKFFNNFPLIRKPEQFYSASENFAKFAKFEHNVAMGMSREEALVDAVQATFNYSDVTPFVRGLRETVMPFATFSSKILQATPKIMVTHPIRAAQFVLAPWLMTQYALKQLNMTNDDFDQVKQLLPEYMQKGQFMLLPAKDAKGRIQLFDLTWWLPGLGNMDITSFAEPSSWLSNPIYSVWADLKGNKRGLSTAPIYNDFDSPEIRTGKMFNYIYQSFFPTWMPSITGLLPGISSDDSAIPLSPAGINWKATIDWYKEKEGAMTGPQVVSSTIGAKVTPVDEQLMATKKEKGIKRLFSDLTAQMNKEIKQNPKDREYIISKYAYAKRQLEEKYYLQRQGGM